MMLATDTREVPVSTLRPGDGFELLLDSTGARRPGYVCQIGTGSALVMLLDRTTKTIRTGEGDEIVIESVTGVQRWSLATPVIPNGERHSLDDFHRKISATSNRDARREAHVELPEKGEVIMAKQRKKVKARKTTTNGTEKLYEIFSSKLAASPYGKKAEDPECTSHTPLVAQVLLKEFDKPASLAAIVEAVKKTKRYGTDSDMKRLIRGDLGVLTREGIVKMTKVEKTAAATA